VTTGFTNQFANNQDIRRDLLAGSLEVCSIRGYGAIEVGANRCRHMASGKRDCGTFRFMQIWRYVKDGTWTVSRKGSYARRTAGTQVARGGRHSMTQADRLASVRATRHRSSVGRASKPFGFRSTAAESRRASQ